MKLYILLVLLSITASLSSANELDTYDPSDDTVHLWQPPSQVAQPSDPPRPVRNFPLEVIQAPKTCNGDTRYCSLRYDQYTWPGTHNSAAYNLGLTCQHARGLWKLVCKNASKYIPQAAYNCLWSNQAGHGIAQQLADGLRAFDLDTCQVDNRAVFCHGGGPTMALGSELDAVFAIFRDFLQQHPREVINLHFGDNTGDSNVITNYIADRLLAYFDGKFVAKQPNDPWPTLGELVSKDTRIIVWFRNKDALKQQYPWVHTTDMIYGTYTYTAEVKTAAALKRHVLEHCEKPEQPQLWQTLDVSYSPSWQTVVYQIFHARGVEMCFSKMADLVYEWLMPVAQTCSQQLKFIHRVNVDQYWRGNLIQVVKYLNEENLKKVASGQLDKH